MKIGALFYVTGHTIDPAGLGRALEDAGFESLWLPEHGILPVTPSQAYPMTGGPIPKVYGQMADPFVTLGFAAAATSTLRLGTCVCIVPEHHPLRLAKQVSTLDSFSGGRFLFGVGAGWLRNEVEAFGADFSTRWTYTREAVDAMKALWRDGSAGYEGDIVRFEPVIVEPIPAQRPHPPVLLGAQTSEATFRRIAAWADGWIAYGVTPEQLKAARVAIADECHKIGRDPDEIEVSAGVRDATPAIQDAFEEAGAARLILSLYNNPGDPIPLDQWPDAALASHTGGPPSADDTLHAIEKIAKLAEL
ncbi:MAG: LLM class F420-dependent oxidoreductase [Ilumatobacteraceae bacterium]